jgi:hypothetical protein
VVAIVDVVRPTHVGLAAETNLIRAAAPRAVYDAVVKMTNDAASDLRARSVTTPLYVSVQVETAWGRLAGSGSGTYVGIDADLRDFPFIAALGLSSYPYLDNARAAAVFQLTFTDLDLSAAPPPPGSILTVFAALGLVDTQLRAKPALAVWDSIFARRRM